MNSLKTRLTPPKKRNLTKPTRSSEKKRLDNKAQARAD